MNENKMKEYEILRAEIMQKIELQNTLLTFTITTSVAVFAFALSQNNIFFYFLPFCVIIPMSIRIAYYTSALTKLAAYMEVFLEGEDGYIWETRNRMLVNKRVDNKKNKLLDFTVYQHNECLILSAVTCFFIIYNIITYDLSIWIKLLLVFFAMLLLLIEIHVTYRINHANKEKENWVNEWTILRNDESNVE